jgi:hypothetical protein
VTHNPLMSRERVIVPPRKPPTKAEKVAAWNRENGICWWCGKPVAQAGPTVEYDHKAARELSADDSLENIYPMHKRGCHDRKTADEDRPAITKAHHQERLTGARIHKSTGFRKHPTLKRTVDGRVVAR